MKNIFLDLTNKLPRKFIEIIQIIDAVATKQAIPYFIIGAFARDVILEYGFNIKSARATRDIDFAIAVKSWGKYNSLFSALLALKDFKPTNIQHRVIYQDELFIDIIPFGKIEKRGQIIWSPHEETVINSIGFKEAFKYAHIVKLAVNLEVRIASIIGLTLLKLISWNDNPADRKRDAQDISLFLSKYVDAGNLNRLYGEHKDIIESANFDYDLASARMLGRDLAKILTKKNCSVIIEILNRETNEKTISKLAEAMDDSHIYREREYQQYLNLLNMFKKGIIETLNLATMK